MKFVFTPLSLVVGLIAGQMSKKIFDLTWGAIKDEEAPRPKHRELPYIELALALLIEGAIAGVMALTGKQKVQQATPPVPEHTVESVKEDVQWTKARAQQGRR